MEKVRRAVKQIACTPASQRLFTLSAFQLSLVPLLSIASSLYSVALRLRRHLYRFNLLEKHRLPVPVISVGNLTWGGNGKTPMVQFLARCFADDGISPLILTRHLSVWRDVEIVMVNALMPWGNHQLLPLGPLREPLTALRRADILVIHHADLMGAAYVDHLDFSDHHLFQLKDIEVVRTRLQELESEYGAKPIVVVTEKDYDRAPEVHKENGIGCGTVRTVKLEFLFLADQE
ncbi:UNVERIFIED_CONTAM: putative tetraacyldisaccharide 4-kinase, mitochondrial [Sesamum indicum]